MKKTILLLAGALFLVTSGCQEEEFSRYPAVAIPQFSDEDYYVLLADKNPEIAYNAVVNLSGRAAEMARILSKENADKNSPQYILAQKSYRQILKLLKSRNPKIAAACLRFLQVFSNAYNKKAELLNPVLAVKSHNPQVLYEQVMALKAIAENNSRITDSLLHKFLDNPSWLVSRSSYLLINSLKKDDLRQELVARYKAAGGEKEKLLILTAFEKQPSDTALDFFFKEILATKSNKVRRAIYDILGNCPNQDKVLTLIAQNYEKILAADGKYLFQRYAAAMEDNFSAKLLGIFLNRGFMADRDFLKLFDERLQEYTLKSDSKPEDREKLNNLKMIEKALLRGKIMAVDWEALHREKEDFNAKISALQADYDVLIKEFSARADEIFKKYGISEEKRKKYLYDVTDSREFIKELFKPD